MIRVNDDGTYTVIFNSAGKVDGRIAMEPGDVEVVLCHNPARSRLIARPGCACPGLR